MKRMLVMTVIGADRPGLVELLASVIAKHGGNWLESRMARLGGQFAGILRVELPESHQEPATAALEKLHEQGLTVTFTTDESDAAVELPAPMLLDIVGHDRPGIVAQISRALASFGVNVEELETECDSAAMTGETLFKARARLRIPPSCNTAELRRELETIAADLIVDISLAEAESRSA